MLFSTLLIDFSIWTTFQASEEYREHSTHKTQRARKTRQRQNQHVVEQRSTTLQESSTVTTKRSSQQELSKKNFNVIRLNSIPLPLASGGTVTCKWHLLFAHTSTILKMFVHSTNFALIPIADTHLFQNLSKKLFHNSYIVILHNDINFECMLRLVGHWKTWKLL